MKIPALVFAVALVVLPAHAQTKKEIPVDAIKKAADVIRALVCPNLLVNLGADLMIIQLAAESLRLTGEHADIKMDRDFRYTAFDRLQENLAVYNRIKCPAVAQLAQGK